MASGVPNLGLEDLVIDPYGPGGEFNSYGGLGLEVELVACEPGEKVGLSHARVSDQHQLEQVVVVIIPSVVGRHRELMGW